MGNQVQQSDYFVCFFTIEIGKSFLPNYLYERKEKKRKEKKRKEKGREGKEKKGKRREGKERAGQDRKGQDKTGQDRTGQERKGKERKGKERKGKERKGKERKYWVYLIITKKNKMVCIACLININYVQTPLFNTLNLKV